MNSRIGLWLATAIVVACVQWGCHLGRPPHGYVAAHGTVWAETPESAESLGRVLDEITPAVRVLLGASSDTHIEVWVDEDVPWSLWWGPPQFYAGSVFMGRVWLRAGSPTAVLAEVLAHEVAHVYLQESVDRGLPWAVEEGLCDVIAQGVAASESGEGSRVWRYLAALWATTGVEPKFQVMIRDRDSPEVEWGVGSAGLVGGRPQEVLRPSELMALGNEPRGDAVVNIMARGVALFILDQAVKRHGLEETCHRVILLAAKDGTPNQWWKALTALAGLAPDSEAWRDVILDDMSVDALRLGLLRAGPGLGAHGQDRQRHSVAALHAIAAAVRRAFPTESIEEMWVLAAPVLILEGTDLRVRLEDITPLAEVFERAWVEVSAASGKLNSP